MKPPPLIPLSMCRSDYGRWLLVTVCRLSCTASLILCINELRSKLLPRTPSINHNLSSVLCAPHPPSPLFLSHLFPSIPPYPSSTPYLLAADSSLLTYFSKDSSYNTICCLSVCCSSLCTCSLSWHFYLHLHLQLLHPPPPPPCTGIVLLP